MQCIGMDLGSQMHRTASIPRTISIFSVPCLAMVTMECRYSHGIPMCVTVWSFVFFEEFTGTNTTNGVAHRTRFSTYMTVGGDMSSAPCLFNERAQDILYGISNRGDGRLTLAAMRTEVLENHES